VQYRRTEIPTMMETFDYPEMGPNCVARNVSIVSPQSLMLMNNHRVHELAQAFAARVAAILNERGLNERGQRDRGAQVDTVYCLALSRLPEEDERALGIAALRELESAWQSNSQAPLETYCHTILNSAAFLYID
jgi:hypothetical protein